MGVYTLKLLKYVPAYLHPEPGSPRAIDIFPRAILRPMLLMSGKAPMDGFAVGAQVSDHKYTVPEPNLKTSLNAFRAGRPMVRLVLVTRFRQKTCGDLWGGRSPGIPNASCARTRSRSSKDC